MTRSLVYHCHCVPPSCLNIIFDSNQNYQFCMNQVVKFMTESPAGGLPLGLLVLSNHTQSTLTEGLKDLKALMPQDAFAGRGKVGNIIRI